MEARPKRLDRHLLASPNNEYLASEGNKSFLPEPSFTGSIYALIYNLGVTLSR